MSTGEDASNDPRWRKFVDVGLKCSCGETHVGLISLSMLVPAGWPGSTDPDSNENLNLDGNFLSTDYCVWEGKYFAIRMSLPMRIQGIESPALLLSVWGSVDRTNFDAYVAAVRNNTLNDRAHAPARLVNRIAGFPDTFGLMGAAIQQPGEPPLLLVLNGADNKPSDHPLIHEERNGITLDRLFDIYAENGHDMRSSFT
ncbi:MAG: DUF2199 domain-containing protein [Alphaproteobacteria bacterium]|nr:DUF2199 domain-containing protein [Alphaproteobacteria bacterium]